MAEIVKNIRALFQQAVKISFDLFKITIPIIIITKVLNEAGWIDHLGIILMPVMELVGLPGSMGLVWATAMITNLYGGMIIFASLAPEANLTVAQVTVLATMMLVAHTLPIELRIAQKAGPRFRFMISLRVIGALVLGWLLHQFFEITSYLQTPNKALWSPLPQSKDWADWAKGEIQNLFYIFCVILVLLVVMRLLDILNITALLSRILAPILKLLGMSKDAAPITIIGMTMGISYGGSLLIQEAKSGRISKKDVFFSFSLMGLCHSIIEDTLLMTVIGGHASGILWGRIVFSLLVIFGMVKLFNKLPDTLFNRYIFRTP